MPNLQWERERSDKFEFICEVEGCPNRADWRLGGLSQGVTWACSDGGLPAYTNGKWNKNSHRYIAAFNWMRAAILRSQERQRQKIELNGGVANRSIFGSLPLSPDGGASDSGQQLET